MSKVVVTGSSGFIGRALTRFLEHERYEVCRLVRHPPTSAKEAQWDPVAARIDLAALEGINALIHLAGESIAAGRWTAARKRKLRESRIPTTDFLARKIAGMADPPRVFISASGIGFYGDRGNDFLDETGARGKGFLAELAHDWEQAASPAESAGIRTVFLRTGMVLGAGGGALRPMLFPFRLGLGGPVGNGSQYISWIALEDMVAAIGHILAEESLRGPVNMATPHPVTNLEFSRTLGRVLKRPAVITMPAFIMRLALGEMANDLLLSSQRALPERLLASGFRFRFPELEPALRSILAP